MKYKLGHRLEAYRTKIDKRDIVGVSIKDDPLLSHYHGVLSADLLGHT
ncbi:MAG: hypothetical protein ACI9QV_000959 [Methylophagaceae bacterium]|jgi:hypothetical protein